MTNLYDITHLKAPLERGEWVLTANRRLRNRIREAYALSQGEVSQSPPVFALHEWLARCWEDLQHRAPMLADGVVVNDLQASELWQQVIRTATGEEQVSKRLVHQAAEAHRQMALWELPLDILARYGEPRDYPLQLWAGAFEEQLAQLGLITREQSYQRIREGFQSGRLPRIALLHLESIPEQPPLLEKLLQAAAGEIAAVPAPEPTANQRLRLACASQEEEIRTAARWAWQRLQEADNSDELSVGIIVPDLGKSRDRVERIFSETFEAQYYHPAQPRYTLPFNISTGTPLGAAPVVSAALQLLALNQGSREAFELRRLLNSPFWGRFESELGIRAAVLNSLESRGQLRYSPTQLRSAAQRCADANGSETDLNFARRLQEAGTFWRRLPARAAAGQWLAPILQLLDSLGWPGDRRLDSVEYQQVKQFYQLLEQVASLDVLDSPLDFASMLSILQQAASATPFQAEVKHSPIQILGSLEGEGLRFDYCWVLGMTSLAWPPRPEPNPLLPIALQRHYQMPRSSVTRELAFAEALTQHYRHCARTVVFSHAALVDEAQMLPSPLITDIPAAGLEAILAGENSQPGLPGFSGLPGFYGALRESQRLELVDCRYAPPFQAPVGEPVRGGTSLLQQQARCPFDAFATLRLGARQPVDAGLGLSPAEKGSALHAIMASVWQQLKDSEGLLKQGEALPALVAAAADKVFAELGPGASFELGERYLQLEQERLCTLILQFLDIEKRRPPFAVIAREEELLREFAGLTFRLRIDRVDRCESGQHLIIDYKSGNSTAIGQWLGERPDEPQLPLYAICYPLPVAGIAFACVRAQEAGYCGLVDEALPRWDKSLKTPAQQLKDDTANWQSTLEGFAGVLENLAREFQAGYAAVDAKNPAVLSRFNAHLLPLNRFREADFITFFLEGRS